MWEVEDSLALGVMVLYRAPGVRDVMAGGAKHSVWCGVPHQEKGM